MNTLVACDFFAKDIVTPFGRKTAYCLFFIHLVSRRVFICPSTYHPDRRWVTQQARNVMMWLDDAGIEPRFLLRDRDAKFSTSFDQVFRDAGVRIVKTPVQAPNANAFAETWVAAVKRECLCHFVCFGRRHLDHVLRHYVAYFNEHRPHQGLGNRTLPEAATGPPETRDSGDPDALDRIRCRRFLGGLLRHYYREAA